MMLYFNGNVTIDVLFHLLIKLKLQVLQVNIVDDAICL